MSSLGSVIPGPAILEYARKQAEKAVLALCSASGLVDNSLPSLSDLEVMADLTQNRLQHEGILLECG